MIENDQQLLVRALDASTNPVLITERTGCIVWTNRAFCLMSGYSKAELIGQTPHLLSSGRQTTTFYRELWMTIIPGLTWQGELIERRKDGSNCQVNQVITPVFDVQGVVTHFIAVLHNFRVADEDRIRMQQLAFHDALTGVAQSQPVPQSAHSSSQSSHSATTAPGVDVHRPGSLQVH
ncbi:sensory box/GGDEF domain protein [Pseudomonas fluorescens]|uniref:Sensory box/GGDEF domain protein n=1 Tax=Pseudomonas fluorescens TaxID=294 RepID=A0A8B4I9N9_PSEFL|nr:PAS domain-containing protein [Pseudomonas fluorescens]SQF91613.1 sensory box/GGDEF domain protein [Pseudomonas fluorescens]